MRSSERGRRGRIKVSPLLAILKEDNDVIVKRVYVWECVVGRLVGQQQKRWIDYVNYCLKKRTLNVRRAKIMVYDRNEWREFLMGNR